MIITAFSCYRLPLLIETRCICPSVQMWEWPVCNDQGLTVHYVYITMYMYAWYNIVFHTCPQHKTNVCGNRWDLWKQALHTCYKPNIIDNKWVINGHKASTCTDVSIAQLVRKISLLGAKRYRCTLFLLFTRRQKTATQDECFSLRVNRPNCCGGAIWYNNRLIQDCAFLYK